MSYIRPTLGSAILAVLLSVTPSPAHAAGEIATRVSIDPLETLVVGTEASIVVTLTQDGGAVVVDEPITLTIDGESRPRRWTDAAGAAIFHLPRDLRPGEHEVVASYGGRTNAYLGATARAVVVIVPYELVVETIPPLPGMAFDIDGTRFEAGADGVARVGLDRLGDHSLSVVTAAYRHPRQRVEFSRWSNEMFGPTIDIRVPLQARLQAGFDVSYQASHVFVDPQGDRVDEGRIEEVTVRNSIGAVITNPDGRPAWYQASRIVRRPTGIESVPIRYTVEMVIVEGANVVNVGQQRFDIEPGDTWPIEVLLYSVRMVPTDALLGFPVGDAVLLTFPSGSTTRIEAVDGEFAADGLARGMYRVALADAPGWSPVTPVALSRDQEVRVRVITYVDVAIVVLLGLGAALGLLHVGRPHLAPAAIAGARGFAGVVRNPQTISAFVARRRAAARSVPEMAPAAARAGEFVLPPIRTRKLSSAIHIEPQSVPPPATPSRGAVPIAQIIRTTFGTSLPAARAEALAPHPPPLSIAGPAVDTPAPTPQRAQSVLVPSIAVAKPLTADAMARARRLLARSAAAPTTETASDSVPIRDEPTQPRRTGSRDAATAKKRPSGKPRRSRDAPTDLPPPPRSVAAQKRQRSKGSPERSSTESVAEPRKRTPPRAKAPVATAPKKRAGATSKANTAPLKPRDGKRSARPQASHISEPTSVQEELTAAKSTKRRGAKPNAVTPRAPRVPKTGAAVLDTPRLPTPSEQTMTPFAAIEEPSVAVAPASGTGGVHGPRVKEVNAVATAAERMDSGGPLGFGRLEAANRPANEVETASSGGYAVRVVPPPPGPDRQAGPRGDASVCAGCRAPAKPGARYCRRCGRATALGEPERERLS